MTVLLYTCVTHHNKKKNALFAHFHGKLAKLKIFHTKCRLFLFNFNFLNNKKIYQNKKNQKIFFSKKIFSKKVVPAITDICTGGQQCKYQLLSSRG